MCPLQGREKDAHRHIKMKKQRRGIKEEEQVEIEGEKRDKHTMACHPRWCVVPQKIQNTTRDHPV